MFGRKSKVYLHLRSYAEAKQKYERTKPLRGSQVRPIGERQFRYESIECTVGGFAAVYYTTRCVEFFENGDIVLRTGGFNTASTASFISDVTGMRARKMGDMVWLWWNGGPHWGGVWVPIKNELKLTRGENGLLQIASPPKLYRKMVNKTVMAQERAKHKPLLKYVGAMLKMSGNTLSYEAAIGVGADIPVTHAQMYEKLLNAREEDYTHLMYVLCGMSYDRYRWHRAFGNNYWAWVSSALQNSLYVFIERVRDMLNQLIKRCVPEVHVEVEVPLADKYPRGVYVRE